jgi:gas vesicle protein
MMASATQKGRRAGPPNVGLDLLVYRQSLQATTRSRGRNVENIREFGYFCLGCAAGAVAAVFLTPKSGPETVEYLRRKAEEGTDCLKQGTDYVKQRVGDASAAVTDAADRGKKTVQYQAESLGAAVQAGKKAYQAAQETTP